jgi:hypothetical protein
MASARDPVESELGRLRYRRTGRTLDPLPATAGRVTIAGVLSR